MRIKNTLCTLRLLICAMAVACASDSSLGKPFDLKCDYRINPIGIEIEKPRFFWKMKSERMAARQTAWQIHVSQSKSHLSENQAEMWDSGWVQSDRSTQIAYQGKALVPMQRYYWRVRTKDEASRVSPWSDIHYFETGLWGEENWGQAQWISCTRKHNKRVYPPDGLMGPWIVGRSKSKEGGKQHSYVFTFDFKGPYAVKADGYWGFTRNMRGKFDISINGEKTFREKGPYSRQMLDFAADIVPGKNRIEITVSAADVPLCFGMTIIDANGNTQRVQSSAQWRMDGSPVKVVAGYGTRRFGKVTTYPLAPLAAAWYKKDFQVASTIKQARLYLCGLGYFEAYVNGQRAGDSVLDPGQSDYETSAMYRIFDVTDAIKPGANALSILLGDGWYNQDRGFGHPHLRYGKPGLRAILRIIDAQGKEHQVVSDTSWKWKESHILMANQYIGEVVDFNRIHDEWKVPGAFSGWKPTTVRPPLSPRLVSQDFEPERKVRTIKPVSIVQSGEKTWTIDLGQNIAGWARLRFKEKPGTRIIVRAFEGEQWKKGVLKSIPDSFRRVHGEPQHHIIIADGKERIYEPRFCYHGFRYLSIHGLNKAPTVEDIQGVVVHTDVKVKARLKSSNPLLEKMFRAGVQTHLNNMHSILQDCPQREKCLWGGDAHSSWGLSYYALEAPAFFRQQIRLFYQGSMDPAGIPGSIGVGKRATTKQGDFTWGVSPLFLAWRNYKTYGDLDTARKNYDSFKTYLQFFEADSPNLIPKRANWGDHAHPLQIERAKQKKELVAALHFFAACERFAELATALEEQNDATWASNLAERIKASIHARYYDKKKKTYGNGTHDSLALGFGMVDGPEERQVAQSLAETYRENGQEFDGGFMSYWTYPMLSRHGNIDLAYQMLINTDYPGLAQSIEKHGATTIWERYFTSNAAAWGKISRDHHAMSYPAAWMITDLAGIRPDPRGTGFKRIYLQPHLPGDLARIDVQIDTLYGLVRSAWEHDKAQFIWNITVPPNTEARVRIPGKGSLEKTIIKPTGTKGPTSAQPFSLVSAKERTYLFKAGSYVITAPF